MINCFRGSRALVVWQHVPGRGNPLPASAI